MTLAAGIRPVPRELEISSHNTTPAVEECPPADDCDELDTKSPVTGSNTVDAAAASPLPPGWTVGASSDCAIVAPPNHYLSQLPTGRAFFDKPLSAMTCPPPRRALEVDSEFEEQDAAIEIEARSYS